MAALQTFKSTRLSNRFKFRTRESCETKLINKTNDTESVVATVDISPSGIAFLNHSKQVLKVGDTAMLELSPFGTAPIRSFVKIVRAEQVAGTMLYGAQFIALPLLHQERLDKIIRTAKFTDEIDDYVNSQDVRTRLNPARIVVRVGWIAVLLTALFTVSRFLDIVAPNS